MNIRQSLALVLLSTSIGCAGEEPAAISTPVSSTNAPATNAPTASGPETISMQEMLVTGSSELKLLTLSLLTQGMYKGEVDGSFLPGFKICAEDSALPIRSVAARLLGQYYVQDKKEPNAEAMELLFRLAKDEAYDVRFNAVYYGLSMVEDKSDELLELLVDTAAKDRDPNLFDRIVESAAADRKRVVAILDRRLKKADNIAVFEIYEAFATKKPENTAAFLQMPSSRPRLFVFSGKEATTESFKKDLEKELKALGIESPVFLEVGSGENRVLMLKTYLTKDYLAVEKAFADHSRFAFSQELWVTPEIELQIEKMQRKD